MIIMNVDIRYHITEINFKQYTNRTFIAVLFAKLQE